MFLSVVAVSWVQKLVRMCNTTFFDTPWFIAVLLHVPRAFSFVVMNKRIANRNAYLELAHVYPDSRAYQVLGNTV